MADQHHDAMWRKNIPADFDGRHGKGWDDEIDAGIIYKSAVAVVVAVAVAFGFCWLLLGGFAAFTEEPMLSPLAEAQERHLPPTPQLEVTPDRILTGLRADNAVATQEYGWADPLTRRIHIPVDQAIDMVLAGGTLKAAAPAPGSAVAAPGLPTDDAAGGSRAGDPAAAPQVPAPHGAAPHGAAPHGAAPHGGGSGH